LWGDLMRNLLRGNQIVSLVKVFQERGVRIYHSCQYRDFQSYLEIGGIPSRKLLVDLGKEFTEFETDLIDQKNGVWDKVFVNPFDYGEIFVRGYPGVPTVYGPIHFVFKPEALLEAQDVAVALRSAGSLGFDRERESLATVEEIERIFAYSRNTEDVTRNNIKKRNAI